MNKRLLLFVIGGIAGTLGAYLVVPSIGSSDAPFIDMRSEQARSTTDLVSTQSSFASAAPGDSGSRDEVRELERRVQNDPMAALLDALALTEPSARRRAVMRVGALWARTDPVAALQSGPTLPADVQDDFRASISSEWANLDAEGFLSYADTASDLQALTEGLTLLLASDPARVFEIAGRLPIATGSALQGGMNTLQRAALNALAHRNPGLALRHVEPMLRGLNINVVAQGVVSRFAQNDPDAALAWLDSLEATTDSHRRVVLGGIARVDFARAFQLAAEEQTTFGLLDSALANGALSDPARAAEVATDLLNDGSSFAGQVLELLAASWARRDPANFTDWFLASSGSIGAPLVRSIASQFAASDLEGAMGLVDRLPQGMRATWIAQIAGPYASQDPLAALDWVQRYQGQPFYEDAHSRVIMQVADTNPELAATMIDGFSPALRSTAAPRIAAALSAQDPRAAAEWALGLTDSAGASGAVTNVVSGWIQRDITSATSWVLGLERGAIRDEALSALISGSYGTNLDPRPILDEIESDETLRQARRMAVFRAASNQLEIARELLETMLDDPEYGDWARESLARIGESDN